MAILNNTPNVGQQNLKKCVLCLESKNLVNSHIIPNAVFKKIKKNGKLKSGQLIKFDDLDNSDIVYSQESWHEPLLCETCEKIINKYEKYGLELLRQTDKAKTEIHEAGIIFRTYEYCLFKNFLTSILWRAAVSEQSVFSRVIIPDDCRERARASLYSQEPLDSLSLGCKLFYLIDTTNQEHGGFSNNSLKQLIVSPIPRLYDGHSYYTFLFLFEGFLLEYFVCAIPQERANEIGMFKNSSEFFVPHKNIFDVPELVDLMMCGREKYERGLTKLQNDY